MTKRQRLFSLVPISALICAAGVGPASATILVPENFTSPGVHEYTVPAGITQIAVVAIGGGGGGMTGGWGAGAGGGGAQVTTFLDVTEGQVFDLFVGGGGTVNNDGNVGGGGGGSTTMFDNSLPLVIAGGGGGNGGFGGANSGGSGCADASGTGGNGEGLGGGYGGGGGTGGARGDGYAVTDPVDEGDGGDGNGGKGGSIRKATPEWALGGAGGDGGGKGGSKWYAADPGNAYDGGGGGGGGYGGGGVGFSGGGGGAGGSLGPVGFTCVAANNGGTVFYDDYWSSYGSTAGGDGSIAIYYGGLPEPDVEVSSPLPTLAPMPDVVQQIDRPSTGCSTFVSDAKLNWAGVSGTGWSPSWESWVNNGKGGEVCVRVLSYNADDARWFIR